jgi:DNA polymerase-1
VELYVVDVVKTRMKATVKSGCPMTPETLDLATWPIYHKMSTKGILIDHGRLEDLRLEVNGLAIQAREEASRIACGLEFNPGSGDQVAELLEARGHRGKSTKGGKRMATDEKSLALIDDPVVKPILKYRGYMKLLGTFIDPTLDKALKGDGRIHPRWKLTRVRSGRAACEDPNLMAFPARDPIGLKVRECFVADPGHVMFSVDYSQIEPRLVAALSGDNTLMAVYKEGRDIYEETARGLFEVQVVDKIKHRLPAKVVTLGVFYGMGAGTLFESLIQSGCGTVANPRFDKEACEQLIRKWFQTYPGVAKYVDEVCRLARRNNGLVLTGGRRPRLLPGLFLDMSRWPQSMLREEAERQAFNHKVQGTAQEYTKRGMIAADKAVGFDPLLQIHDELVGQIEEEAIEAVPMIAEAMEHVDILGTNLCLPTEFVTGPNWASLKG